MESQAYFTGIREKIIEHLQAATDSVLVAVAWLTDRALFEALVACQRRGVAVSLAVLDDRLNRKSTIAWERLTALGGRLCWIPEGGKRAGSLHHKFCLIDNDTVINGSFNWTQRASSADENIVIMQGDPAFAAQFRDAFVRLLDKHGHDTEPEPIDRVKLMARLAVIAKLLELEDFDDLTKQASKLENAKGLPEIADLIELMNRQRWPEAMAHVTALITRGLAIAIYQDPRIEEWRWQVQVLENQLMALEVELADMQRQIHLFDYQQDQAIGDLIRDYLDVKRRVLHARHKRDGQDHSHREAQAADGTFEQYEEARAAQANEPKPEQLSPGQLADLKKLYRKLAQRCHPDRMKDDDRAWATDMFKALEAANRNSDLVTMQRLQNQIERGPGADAMVQIPEQADQLQARLTELQAVLGQVSAQLAALQRSSTWQTLSTQADWGAWFEQKAVQLREEIGRFQAEMDGLLTEDAV